MEQERQKHHMAIHERHPDYQDIANSEAFANWLKEQPPVLQRTYVATIQSGTVDDIDFMFTQYKQQSKNNGHKPTQHQTTSQPATTKEKAKAARGVSSSAAPPPKGSPDPYDFEAAWEEASRRR